MKHFTNDLQPYQHNDSSGGLMYIHRDVQFIFHLCVKAFSWEKFEKELFFFFFDNLTIGNQSPIMNAQNIWRGR